jgi:short-subunit dehydrogenase
MHMGGTIVDIAGAHIAITGAAGGLGAAMARALAGRGARLMLSGRNEVALNALADEVGGEAVVADLCERDQVELLASQVQSLDALVLNAGIGTDAAVADVTVDEIDTVIDTNLRAPIQLAMPFVQHHLATSTPGSLVLIGSVAGVSTTPESRMYNATKFGLRGFALSLRQDLHGTPVGVTHVLPGFVRDAGMFVDSGTQLPPGVRTRSPADVAAAVCRAIEHGPAEIFVAPPELRLGATVAGTMPAVSAALLRRFGAGQRKAASR